MNENKKIISDSLALALGVSLIIPNAKANEEKTVEKALKEPVKTSENVKVELNFLRFEIYNPKFSEKGFDKERLKEMKLQYEKQPKARTWEEMREKLGYNKEYFARSLLAM